MEVLRTNPPWREEMVGAATDVERWAKDQVDAIEKILDGLTIGGLAVRRLGAAAVALGIAANLAGNLLSLRL